MILEIHTCLRCGHRWAGRKTGRPRLCPNHKCQSTAWDRPREAHAEKPLTFRRLHPELHELGIGQTLFLPFNRKNVHDEDPRPARSVDYERRKFGKRFETLATMLGLNVRRIA